jgi:hypothetical protein
LLEQPPSRKPLSVVRRIEGSNPSPSALSSRKLGVSKAFGSRLGGSRGRRLPRSYPVGHEPAREFLPRNYLACWTRASRAPRAGSLPSSESSGWPGRWKRAYSLVSMCKRSPGKATRSVWPAREAPVVAVRALPAAAPSTLSSGRSRSRPRRGVAPACLPPARADRLLVPGREATRTASWSARTIEQAREARALSGSGVPPAAQPAVSGRNRDVERVTPTRASSTRARSRARAGSDRQVRVSHYGETSVSVGKDDVARVQWSLVPVDLGCAQREQPFDLSRLILGVEVEV